MASLKITRRRFLAHAALLALPPWLLRCSTLESGSKAKESAEAFLDASPIEKNPVSLDSVFGGDEPARAHSLLWDLPSLTNAIEALPVSETVAVVIVGGGMSGLLSARYLKDYSPLVLEQASRFGGNSRGESMDGNEASLGAAYFVNPTAGTPEHALLKSLGLQEKTKLIREGAYASAGNLKENFWKRYPKIEEYLKKHAPEIPYRTSLEGEAAKKFDEENLEAHLTRKLGPLPGPVKDFLNLYCFSSLNASAKEVSAAAGLNFLSAEFGDTCTLPGGNAAIAEALYQQLSHELPKNSLRAQCVVVRVQSQPKGCEVTYSDSAGTLKKILSQVVVMACPKFVTARILHEIEPERAEAIRSLKYRPYLVANVGLKRRTLGKYYDLIHLKPVVTGEDVESKLPPYQVTDIVDNSFSQNDGVKSLLTLYLPIPKDSSRAMLYHPSAWQRYRDLVQKELEVLLPLYGLKTGDIARVRMARWGHALPIPYQGIYRSGNLEILQKPFRDKVFFVEQDNWALPAFETCVAEAKFWTDRIRTNLSSR